MVKNEIQCGMKLCGLHLWIIIHCSKACVWFWSVSSGSTWSQYLFLWWVPSFEKCSSLKSLCSNPFVNQSVSSLSLLAFCIKYCVFLWCGRSHAAISFCWYKMLPILNCSCTLTGSNRDINKQHLDGAGIAAAILHPSMGPWAPRHQVLGAAASWKRSCCSPPAALWAGSPTPHGLTLALVLWVSHLRNWSLLLSGGGGTGNPVALVARGT